MAKDVDNFVPTHKGSNYCPTWKNVDTRIRLDPPSRYCHQLYGSSERTNKNVGQILCSYTSKRQGKWLEALPAVEFAINFAVNVSTGISPLELLFGQPPTLFSLAPNTPMIPALSRWLRLCEACWHEAQDQLCLSCIRQAHQHNKKTSNTEPIAAGSSVLLNSANWHALRQPGSDELKEHFEGPYPVLRVFNHGQKVKLDLPDSNLCHPAFQISKVKPYVDSSRVARSSTIKVSSSHECTPSGATTS
ncbi:hypothetical protein PCASD_02605 [Puccinia coronata f. sp. avenae]|uniref:Integrase catalytic domain-containing protein n=1 Tax=Puccinia coronata f. sp. avenae TaxID=200324 RepID=A0A2N5VBE7_9BASI|nr:hypothetical protein PCASD_02605 [Puccinia coronata f. sp. avenae]